MPKDTTKTDEITALAAKLVNVNQLARAIGRHPDTIRRWGREEGMPYHQAGGIRGKWDINVDEFQAWFRNRCFAHGTNNEPTP